MHLSPRTRFWLAAAGGMIALAFLAVVLSNDKAKAQEVYFGVHAGKSLAGTELSNTGSTFSLDGLSSQGYVAGVHAGIDVKGPNSPLFAGVFAGYDWQNTQFSVTAGSSNFNIGLHDSWYAGLRAGFVVHGAKIYALAAYRQTEASTSVSTLTIANPKGFDLGLGVNVPITKGISFGIEGIRTQYQRDEFQFGSPSGPTGVFAQMDQLQAMARLNIDLDFGRGSIFDDRTATSAAKGCDKKLGNC